MPDCRFLSRVIPGLIFCTFVWSNDADAYLMMEQRLAQGTDALAPHLFLLNPAVHHPETLRGNLFSLRSSSKNELTSLDTRDNDENLSKNERTEEILGVALVSDVGSGLGIGVIYQKYGRNNLAIDEDGDQAEEGLDATYVAGRAVVALTDEVSAGIIIRTLDQKVAVVGNINMSPQVVTEIKTSLFGTGGGLYVDYEPYFIGAAYLPALKGKADILGEERIITEPGAVEIAGAFRGVPAAFGFAVRRWLYKKDGRFDGTTLNDANGTRIDLWGLNFEDSLLFPLDEKQLGFDFYFGKKATLRISLSQTDAEINFDPNENPPGTNEDAEIVKINNAHVSFSFLFNKITLSAHVRRKLLDHEFTINDQIQVSLASSLQDITVGVGTDL